MVNACTKRKIGLLGGSFNPFHNAHLRLALTALSQLALDEVQLIPAGQPWQKTVAVSAEHRLAMLQLAIQGASQLTINPIEIERTGPSYTIDTVKNLPTHADYYWLMGSDQLNNFCTWKEWQAILHYVQLVVVKRPHYEVNPPQELLDTLAKNHQSLIFLHFDEIDLSSTHIRDKLMRGESVETFIHPDVLHYIEKNNLYKA
uniref:Probable nicotinate-nucleotide adenylyltransferase n=1 Tax=uncultured bacterium IN-01 TaxID=1805579 RepID=A0A142BVH5_9BACT|nr:putative nicotinate-nucleotide adenylyltransferase [uncultured bacterium IN-01]